ncbi:glutathione S-transferase family protein [Parasphingorhabdus sp.]|uniref:glutathione S-transferase family protein n=1 Tax=Parasphingorhabdus sp. TaxID=2709688 RepID=UPI002F9240DD
MKFYDFAVFAPNPWIVWIFAQEKGIKLERCEVDLLTRENRREPFLSEVNPLGELPALVTQEGYPLSEVVPICEYLEDSFPSLPLIGSTPWERAETRMWVRRIDQNIAWPMGEGFSVEDGRSFFEADEKDSDIKSTKVLLPREAAPLLKNKAMNKLVWLNSQMEGREWICDNRYTLADIYLYAFLQFGENHGQPLPTGCEWLHDFFSRMKKRPYAWHGKPGSLS